MRYFILLLTTLTISRLQAQEIPDNNISVVVDCNDRATFVFTDTIPREEMQIVEWNFGDGTVIDAMPATNSVTHTYSVAQSMKFTLSLKKKNLYTGEISIVTKDVFVVNEQPSFNVNTLETCLQNKVAFEPEGIKSQFIKTYQWDFGDGKTSLKTNTKLSSKFDGSISYAFADPGQYKAQLTITDVNGCSKMFEYPDVIHIKGPVAKFKATNTTSCKEESFARTIKDASTPDRATINKWEWYVWETGTTVPAFPSMAFDDAHPMNATGVTFNLSNLNHAYKGYSVKLVVTDNENCISAAKTSSSYIKSYWPKAAIESDRILLCNENIVQLNDASTGNKLDYTWIYGDGETDAAAGSHAHAYEHDGLYSLKLIVAEKQMNTCKDEVTKNDYVKIVSVKAAFEMEESKQCAAVPVGFIDRSINAATYNWDFGDGRASSEIAPLHTFDAGDHIITLTVKTLADECTSSVNMPLHVYEKPSVFINGNDLVCLEKNVQPLHYQSYVKGADLPIAYQWKMDGELVSNNPDLSYDYRQRGNHSLALAVSVSDYCAGDVQKNIVIDAIPALDDADTYTVNSGENVDLQIGATGNELQYQWVPTTGLSCYDCANPVFNSAIGKQYRVSVSTPNGCMAGKDVVVTVITNNNGDGNENNNNNNVKCSGVAMPNAFTPNGDGRNDVFYIKGCDVSFVKSFRIYDKWGRQVFMKTNFAPNDKRFGWDGAGIMHTGTFVYIAEIVDKLGKSQQLKGAVMLLK